MRICDLPQDKIVVGMRLRSLVDPNRLGTIVKIDIDDSNEPYHWIHWDGEKKPWGGFFFNDCKCEVVDGLHSPA